MADVFPLRNLPTDAEDWGRTVEDRIYQAENSLSGSRQSLSGMNRATSSTLENLAYQVQQVQDLYDALPKVHQGTTSPTGFGVPATGVWNTIASVNIPLFSPGRFDVRADASGQLVSGGSSTLMTASYRLVATASSASPEVPGLFSSPSGTFVNNFKVNWGWVIPVTIETPTITISLQCKPDDGTSWPSGTGSYAVLTAFGTLVN